MLVANLKVNFAGVEFKNPIWLGSATPTWDGQRMKSGGFAGAGAVVPKTIGPRNHWTKHPQNGRLKLIRNGETPIGMVNLELFTTKTIQDWINEELKIAKQGGTKIVASILAMPDLQATRENVKKIQETGLVDMLELNVSCPMPKSSVGIHIGMDQILTYKQVSAAKEAAEIPLSVKLSSSLYSLLDIGKAAEEGGADALTVGNSIKAFAGVDIETGKPFLGGYGGYSGPAIKPIVQRHISELAREINLPICAVGGISSWRDIVEYIMLGASTVQVVTTVMWKGYGIIMEFLKEIDKFMTEKGYNSVEDFRGVALPYINSVESIAEQPPKCARIDPEACVKCNLCSSLCFYGAIRVQENSTSVDTEKCDGCGLCVEICSAGAVKLVKRDEEHVC